ncbi:MAG: 16S rRNA (guanine(527)-N(7))-methyltransferase RsmG [Firmicutes bacterium]|nr:16S rRNA (guanine(527)-N(7))-methyltransferase RsmG [Bacillota bacterium]
MNIFQNPELAKQLELYNNLLVEHNKITNLTAHRTLEQSLKYNIEDSLLFNKEITPYLTSDSQINVLDIGSGGGCPAIPLKLCFPQINLTMVDSVNKKITFLNNTITKLNLNDAIAIHTRLEDFKPQTTHSCHTKKDVFDIITARALAPLPTLLEYALPFLKIGGKFLAFKGSRVHDEIKESQTALQILGGQIINITEKNLGNEPRSLIIIQKTKQTNPIYPRPKNLPRHKPI